jgi:hypothetical protein
VAPYLLAQHGKSPSFGWFFFVEPWLYHIDQCTEDYPTGVFKDEDLELVLPFDESQLGPCEKPCEPVSPPPTFAACGGLFGDVNANGTVNIADGQCTILTALWEMGGQQTGLPTCLGPDGAGMADLDCDGLVTIADVMLDLQAVVGIPVSLALDGDGNGCPDACESVCGDCVCGPNENCALCGFDCGACEANGEPGACCAANQCTELDAAACAGAGGSFLGAQSVCGGPDFCATHVPGACCTPFGCSAQTALQCNASGGLHQGAGTDCNTSGICGP